MVKLKDTKYIQPPVWLPGGYYCGVESIETYLEEVKKQHAEHWKETEYGYLGAELKGDYEWVAAAEQRGRVMMFTLREEMHAKLVGNAMILIGPALHMKGLSVATEDTFFIDPEYRKKGLASDFITYIKVTLARKGVSYLTMTDKFPVGGKSLEKLFAAHDFAPVARTYIAKL